MNASEGLGARAMNTARVEPAMGAAALRLDEDSLARLRQCALTAVSADYNDGSLAADLLKLAQTAHGSAQQACLQRMSLAAQFLNQAIADPLVPTGRRLQYELLRLPLFKAALADSTLFSSALHPLTALVNELMLKAACARISDDDQMGAMMERLQDFLAQFDLAPEFVKAAAAAAVPVPEPVLRQFLDFQHRQLLQRRETVMAEARRRALRELENGCFGRDIPEPALNFLRSAWGPLLVKRLIEQGAEHHAWKSGVALMEQLLDLLEARVPNAAPPAEWERLLKAMAEDLNGVGLSAGALAGTLAQLEVARVSAPGSLAAL